MGRAALGLALFGRGAGGGGVGDVHATSEVSVKSLSNTRAVKPWKTNVPRRYITGTIAELPSRWGSKREDTEERWKVVPR